MTPTPGTPCWIDLSTADRDAAVAFYTALLGWTAMPPNPEFGGYTSLLLDGAPVAGVMAKPEGDLTRDGWATYLATDDVRATAARAEALGGRLMFPAHDVGDLGAMAFLVDPTGAVVGLWEPRAHRGYDQARPVGGVVWHELHTRDAARAVAFYAGLLGARADAVSDTPELRYTTLTPAGDDTARAGVMDARAHLPEDVPAYWTVYVRVADVDATAARAVELGGSVVSAAMDTPWGRMATLADPGGATFRVMAPQG